MNSQIWNKPMNDENVPFLDLQYTNFFLEGCYMIWVTKLPIIIGSICLNYVINDSLQ